MKPVFVGPAMRIVHPEYGDLTEDVARELAQLNAAEAERVRARAERRQRHIARVCGQEGLTGAAGLRPIAQIDAGVYGYWEHREGPEFWKHELGYMCRRHPELAVRARPARTTVLLDGFGHPAVPAP